MKLIDLSHTLSSDTKPYPGSAPPQIKQTALIEKNGYREKMLGLSSHLGTHMDAPAHMLSSGQTLDNFSVEKFYGRAFVIDAKQNIAAGIPVSVLEQLPENEQLDFILFYTGWSGKWGSAEYFLSFPFLSQELAKRLSEMNLKGVGLDAPSVDARDSNTFPAHHLLMGKNMLIIENLCHLEKLINRSFTLAAFPLKINNADGSPVRAVAILEQEKFK